MLKLKEHDPLIISIAAGKTIETISSYLSYEPALVRVMPSINATIGASMSAYCANGRVSAEQKAFVAKLCSSIGEAVELDEKFFSAFGVIGGAAPAFAYMFIDELARGGVKIGMKQTGRAESCGSDRARQREDDSGERGAPLCSCG